MGHKVHPYGFRLGISRTWSAKWYADKDYATLLQEDLAMRKLIERRLANASVGGVEIERGINYVTVTIHTAKPGIVIGKGGANVAQQLSRRIAFRKAMKQAIQRTMKAGAKGVKIAVAGRLGGSEMARREWDREGRIPLGTLRADISYGYVLSRTTYGTIGVKVWIYRGDVPDQRVTRPVAAQAAVPAVAQGA